MLDKDTMWIFHAAEGYDIAIAESEIIAIWQAEKPGHTLIERADGDVIEVLYDFKDVKKDFDSFDTRKRAAKIAAAGIATTVDARKERGRIVPLFSSKDAR